jgi:L-aminopeptidase/D-esterase-like protein
MERDGIHLGALMVVNAVGDVRDPETGRLIAGARDTAEGRRLVDTAAALAAGAPRPAFRPVNTTIGVVATTARLDKPEAARLARRAMEGFTRALSPPHLDTDGDTLFCLSVGTARADVDMLGRAAADLVARAIVRAVRAATRAAGLPAARDLE